MSEYDVVTRTLKKKRYMKIRAAVEEVVDAAEKESFFEEEPHNMLVDEEPEVPTTSEEVPKSFRMKRKLLKERAAETEKKLQEYEERINADGYYDEVRPADSGSHFKPKVKHAWWKYAIVGGLFLFGIIMIVSSVGALMG